MKDITIRLSEEEFQGVIQAYQTLQTFLEKVISPNELYQTKFLPGLHEALDDVKAGRFQEVRSLEDFVR